MCGIFMTLSCADEPYDVQPMDNLKTEILPNGDATSGAVFSRIDEKTFWLDYVKYRIVDSHLEIIGYDNVELRKEPKLYAEVTIDGATLKTRRIGCFNGEGAFEYAKCEKIIIPETVTYIDDACFRNCTSLTSITLPEGLTGIGYGCFSDCESLASITLPEGLTKIEDRCFYGCTSLVSITLPEDLTYIGSSCFCNCISLTSMTLPEGITRIEDCSFNGCMSLTSIMLPDRLLSMGEGCFCHCESLISITLPEDLKEIGYGCFSG